VVFLGKNFESLDQPELAASNEDPRQDWRVEMQTRA